MTLHRALQDDTTHMSSSLGQRSSPSPAVLGCEDAQDFDPVGLLPQLETILHGLLELSGQEGVQLILSRIGPVSRKHLTQDLPADLGR